MADFSMVVGAADQAAAMVKQVRTDIDLITQPVTRIGTDEPMLSRVVVGDEAARLISRLERTPVQLDGKS